MWKVVPQSRTGGRETPITEFVVCSRHKQLPHVIGVGAQWATTNVRQKATVVCEVRGSRFRCVYCASSVSSTQATAAVVGDGGSSLLSSFARHRHRHGRVAGEGRRVVAPPCPRSTARRQRSPVGRVQSFRSWSSHLFRGRPAGRRHVRSRGRSSDTLMWS